MVGPRVSFIVRADLIHYEGLPLLPEARIDLIHEIRHHVSSADTTRARRASELGKTAKVEREREGEGDQSKEEEEEEERSWGGGRGRESDDGSAECRNSPPPTESNPITSIF